jgi:hypothetical protein
MIKWFVYIVLLLILMPCLSNASIRAGHHHAVLKSHHLWHGSLTGIAADTTNKTSKQKQQESDKKIKEVAKAKRLPKPEKIEDGTGNSGSATKAKPKRQRRPAGMERPPEIPRRNGS